MFIKKEKDTSKLIDTVFTIVSKASIAKQEYGSENVIDASIGSLFDEVNPQTGRSFYIGNVINQNSKLI